jgi:hypothetical protein
MSTPIPSSATLIRASQANTFDQAEIAAAAYLACYRCRTLETYRYDLRTFFQWCANVGLDVLEAKRACGERRWRSAVVRFRKRAETPSLVAFQRRAVHERPSMALQPCC